MLKYETESIKFFLLASIILLSLLIIKPNIEIAFSQISSLPKSFQIKNSTYIILPSLGMNQIKEYESKFRCYYIKNSSSISYPLMNFSSYTVTNATKNIDKKTINGLNKDNSAFYSQNIVIPKENIINGKITFYK